MLATAFVYILTNARHTTVYIGITVDIATRVWEHKTKQNPRFFTARYNVNKLVYFEPCESIIAAIAREKTLKGKSRKFKNELIASQNPEWRELSVSSAVNFTTSD
jgi:putative endonuclease